MRALPISALVLLVLGACTPSTFDGLTSGNDGKRGPFFSDPDPIENDEALRGKDPRPVSPFSGSWVNTANPRFTWKLQEGTTGAVVELSKTRDFATVEKRMVGTGSELTVPDALETGLYFWRLQARAGENGGVSYSPTWTVLVRGKSKNATVENTAAHGGIADSDGDGIPELAVHVVTRDFIDETETEMADFPLVISLVGVNPVGRPAAFDPFSIDKQYWADAATDAPAIAAGFDINGDGYGDLVVADVWQADSPSAQYVIPGGGGAILPLYGGPAERPREGDEPTNGYPHLVAQPFTTVPALAAGDFNGDGYGDISAIFSDLAVSMNGGHSAFTLLPFEAPGASPPTTFTVRTGDFDGDGLTDFAYTPFDSVAPLRLTKGSPLRYSASPNLTVGSDLATPTRASALATGDFDGDGFDEVAFATTIDGKAAVCVHSAASTTLTKHACWLGDAPVAGFGLTLGAGDVDADGVDEIFVGSTSGITILAHAGIGYADETSVFTATPVSGSYSPYLSVFYPGRPGKAQWAVYGTGAEAKTLFVIDGGADGAVTKYDFTKLKEAKDVRLDVLRFGATIR